MGRFCAKFWFIMKKKQHDDVMRWKPFPHYWPFVMGTTGHRWIFHKETIMRSFEAFFVVSLNRFLTVEHTIELSVIWHDMKLTVLGVIVMKLKIDIWPNSIQFVTLWTLQIMKNIYHVEIATNKGIFIWSVSNKFRRNLNQCWMVLRGFLKLFLKYWLTPNWHFKTILIRCGPLCHWNGNVIILMKFSSLAAREVVKMTTYSATSDENFIKMITFPFQCSIHYTFQFCCIWMTNMIGMTVTCH